MGLARALLLTLALTGCRATEPVVAPAPTRTGVVEEVPDTSIVKPTERAPLTTQVLPSVVATATLKTGTPLLQRPVAGSVILKTLPAGETVRVLGTLENSDGRWQSIGLGETQGWVRAEALHTGNN